ncbi:hypothetical protein [Actinophytocola xanthii]|uniref:ABM domain-containing protein n=1 Tax=Actinophytocola xanthii TaxID=1912961 RepID=A0A1Q8CA97_9PSEU|nr:hypothetical protein [Actinophytocola xanthii]OLF11285.1 hypothetical protein BU204_30650 [Actinophytocola xanthii]
MIHVLETWRIKPEFTDRIPELMQRMDDLVGPPAHEHPAFLGHATFLQHDDEPTRVDVLYPWRSREEAEALTAGEGPLIDDFQARYCSVPREIVYLTEVPHEHDHDHEHDHNHGEE